MIRFKLLPTLCQVDVTRRFGTLCDGTGDIKLHPWFIMTNWGGIYYQKIAPPYVHPTPLQGMSEEASREAQKTISMMSLVPTDEYVGEFEEF